MQDFWALHPFVAQAQPQEHHNLRLERVLPGKPRLSSQTDLSFLPRVFCCSPGQHASFEPSSRHEGRRTRSVATLLGWGAKPAFGRRGAPDKQSRAPLPVEATAARRRQALDVLHAGPITQTRCQRRPNPQQCRRARQPNTGRERARGAPTQKHGRRLRRRPRLS